MTSTYFKTKHVRLHAMTAGPGNGPLVVLLHGFPDFWYGWRHQIDFLAKRGFRVVAPDQRGYNLSDKPKGIASYRASLLADDIAELIESTGRQKAFVVGHDWGGAVTWRLVSRRPDLVERFVVMNCPHPKAFTRVLRRSPAQLVKSWYVFFFQLPFIPEAAVRARNYEALEAGLRMSKPGTFSDEDLARYREAWSQPGALTSMIHWYRAFLRSGKKKGEPFVKRERSRPPGMMLWGTRDRYLDETLADESRRAYEGLRLELLPGVSHWVPNEAPEKVNALLADFLTPKAVNA